MSYISRSRVESVSPFRRLYCHADTFVLALLLCHSKPGPYQAVSVQAQFVSGCGELQTFCCRFFGIAFPQRGLNKDPWTTCVDMLLKDDSLDQFRFTVWRKQRRSQIARSLFGCIAVSFEQFTARRRAFRGYFVQDFKIFRVEVFDELFDQVVSKAFGSFDSNFPGHTFK